MDAEERARLIWEYRDGYRAVKEALDGITEQELDHAAADRPIGPSSRRCDGRARPAYS